MKEQRPDTAGMTAIRRASARDFLDIAALDRLAWLGNRHGEFIPDGEHVWRLWCEHAWCFAARLEGESCIESPAGTLAGAIVAFPCLDGRFCVHKVMVLPALRGRGIGSRLFAVLLEELDRQGVATFLTVDPSNESAQRLYASWGYVRDRFVAGFYRPVEDRWVLARSAGVQS